ncbi:MAG: A/G-specific adenine glycosylase [Gemmatimonadaceae bacterium]
MPRDVVIDPAVARKVSRTLRAWFRRHGRDLPWRRTRDPYRVLVSELMLQQTQVSRVVDFYERFLQRFPTLETVAQAPRGQVMERWEGLGYYARARNLHALARVVRDQHQGAIPDQVPALRALPGVGPYTAGAVASFAYERPAPLVDTNVARVLSRLFAPQLKPKRARDLSQLWRIAASILPRTGKAAWAHNQALMELGAMVCTARVAHCARCPVRRSCVSAKPPTASPRRTTSPSTGRTQ